MAGSQGIRAGAAYVELFADDSKLIRGLNRARGQLRSFGRAVTEIGAGLTTAGTWLAGMGAAIVAPLVGATKLYGDVGKELVGMSRRTGMSVEALSELSYAAGQSGSNLETLETGVRRMQRTIGAAAGGSKSAADALADLGLSAGTLLGMKPEEQFSAVADALSRIADPTLRAAAAMQVFGRGGTALLPMLSGGAAGLAEMRAEAQRLGLTISTEDAQAAMKFHETLNLMWTALKRVAFAVGSALAPTLSDAARWLIDAARAAGAWIKEHQGLVVLALKIGVGLAVAGGALIALGTVISTVGSVFTTLAAGLSIATTLLPMIGAAIAAIATPVGAVVAVAVALGAALVAVAGYGLYASGALGAAWDWLSEKTRVLREDFMDALSGIANALASGDIGLAAKILWLTLKMEWQRGVSYLTGIWVEWKTSFLDTATDAFYKLSAVWSETVDMLRTTWAVFTGLVALGWNNLKAKLGVITPEQAAANRADIVKGTDAEIDASEKARNAAVDEAARNAVAAREAHKKSAGDALAAAEKDLADARKEWQDALARAHSARAAEVGAGGPAAPKPFDAFAGLSSSLQDVQRRVGVAGGFNGAAAWGMVGAGSVERIAKATEETAQHTKAIADGMDDGETFD